MPAPAAGHRCGSSEKEWTYAPDPRASLATVPVNPNRHRGFRGGPTPGRVLVGALVCALLGGSGALAEEGNATTRAASTEGSARDMP